MGTMPDQTNPFSKGRSEAILIAAVTSASISLIASLSAFRWFMLMRRTFRHHLILALIMSDMFKALWYLIYPVVVFTRGEPADSSNFCQASGFFLSLGTEASDFAILMIALHAGLYIFRPPQNSGEGGLYAYRLWIYPLWIALPVLSASLAFTNPANAYVNTITYCYLPKRPFWYRLALAWIPRYLIFITIFALYAGISIYVHLKFKRFGNLGSHDSCYGGNSGHSVTAEQEEYTRNGTSADTTLTEDTLVQNPDSWAPSAASISQDPSKSCQELLPPGSVDRNQGWRNFDFKTCHPSVEPTTRPYQAAPASSLAPSSGHSSSGTKVPLKHMSLRFEDATHPKRAKSEAPTFETNITGDTFATCNSSTTTRGGRANSIEDQLLLTRMAIRRQLRFLFIYPVVYLIMWILPFASHCLQYSDYYSEHPPFWLMISTTSILALQAGVDATVFSWREKPWRRSCGTSTGFTIAWKRFIGQKVDHESTATGAEMTAPSECVGNCRPGKRPSRVALWWEEEGRKRKDSVWMGTDAANDTARPKESFQKEKDETD